MPVFTRLATRLPRATSLVKTEPPNPKSESLASATASSSFLTRKKSATGPKNSSRKAGLPGLIFVRIVGCMKEPGRSMRLPPITGVAPLATARLTWPSSFTRAASVDRGPSVVALSIGSPGWSAASALWNLSRKRSASSSTTMKRFAATQHWPMLFILAQTAHLTVLSRSASSSTMKASLPPSSIVDFLRFCPALSATFFPASTLPVNATPLIRGSSITRLSGNLPRLVREYADHLMDRETSRSCLHQQIPGGQTQVVNGGPIVLVIFCKSQTDDAQDKHRCSLGPRLVCFHETGEESSELPGVFPGRNQIVRRLFVVGGRRPASRLKQRMEVGIRHRTVFEAVRTPTFGENLKDWMICRCFLDR